jgi:argonaute-like protein implicated in RNA metabolism and viral defense
MKSHYKTLKINSLKKLNPKVTQVTLTTTLNKKGFASILTKVLIQISSKIGNVPWSPKLPNGINIKTMLIGIDTSKSLGKSDNTVAYCCTLDKNMTKIHSNYYYQTLSNNLSVKIGDLVCDCLSSYAKFNKFFP